MTAGLPRAQARIAGDSPPDPVWYDFFRRLLAVAEESGADHELIQGILQRLDELESQEIGSLVGPQSVRVQGAIPTGAVLSLRGDQTNPLGVSFYSTDEARDKGWNLLYPNWVPNPYADYLTDPDGNYLTDPDGNFLMSQDGFPIPLEYGGTGGDYLSVNQNLFFASPDGSTGAPIFRAVVADDIPGHNDVNGLQGGTAGEFYHLTAVQHTDVASLSTGGTTGQFWRGDQAYSNELMGVALVTLDGAGVGLTVTKYSGDAAAFQYRCQKARGSLASPSAVSANDAILTFQARAYHSGGAFSGNVGDVQIQADEAFTSSAQGTSARVRTVAATTTTLADRFIVDSTRASPGATNTQTLGDSSLRWATGFVRDLVVGSATASLGGGVGVSFHSNASTNPSSNPTGGGILYADAGAGKWRGSSGTVTTFGPANPHCPTCGTDFVHEWDNAERYGYLAVCMNCFANGIHTHTRERGAWNRD